MATPDQDNANGFERVIKREIVKPDGAKIFETEIVKSDGAKIFKAIDVPSAGPIPAFRGGVPNFFQNVEGPFEGVEFIILPRGYKDLMHWGETILGFGKYERGSK